METLILLSLPTLTPSIVGTQKVRYPWYQHQAYSIIVAFYSQRRGSAIALGIDIAVFATPGLQTPSNGLQIA
ncbi:MAG TPA: hypothetical protein PKH24_05755 [Sedimentisphaerales bacterium]|jgi:hypothetical protein|nr:hypothetical protein [Sedimentisphaerales bacterium]HNU29089.1 hypothetical protein [Sedimentisphaerales bacterium]